MKSPKTKTKYLCYLSVLFLLLIAPICARIYTTISTRNQAEEYVSQGMYSEARQLYEKLGDEEMLDYVDQLVLERDYDAACILMESGKYEEAKTALFALGEYKDSANLLLDCDYFWANELNAAGEYAAARKLLLDLDADYPGRDAALEESSRGMLNAGLEYVLLGQYSEALELWKELGDYADAQKLASSVEKMLNWLSGKERIISESKLFNSSYYNNVYIHPEAYIVLPEYCGKNTKFLLYYPGGMDEEISIDFIHYYLMNPEPDTIVVFMRKKGIKDMREKNTQAIELMERVAAECGVFVHDVVVVGSSMGAYPAMHSAYWTKLDFGINVPCVLSLDAGVDWNTIYVLRRDECVALAENQTEFYLFESPWVGTERAAIKMLVETGNYVIRVGCIYDEHERITMDAMGMGVLHWALGDRSQACDLDIYIFTRLTE